MPRGIVIGAVSLIVGVILFTQTLHVNDVQNLQVIQSINGDVTVRREAGWYPMICPRIWTYPKAGVYQLNAEDKDLLDIQFRNKTTAKLRANIGYRIDGASNDVIISLHQQVESDGEKIWKMLLTALNTAVQSITTKYDPSDVIGGDKFETMVREIYSAIMHNPELMKHGIDVNYFAVDGRPIPDSATEAQFTEQKKADLARRLAAAKVAQLEAETEQERAEAARKTEHEKIEAQAQMAKEKLDFERQKQNETIAAEKKLALAKIEKEAAEVRAQQEATVAKINAEKAKTIAEIEKQTEAEKLEVVKLQGEQKKVTAAADKQAIEMAGKLTEQEQFRLTVEKETKIGVAQAYAEGIGKIKLPVIMQNGNGANGNSGPADAMKTFFDLKNAAIAIEMSEQTKSK